MFIRHSVGEGQRVIKPLPDLILVLKCHRSRRPLLLHSSAEGGLFLLSDYTEELLSDMVPGARREGGGASVAERRDAAPRSSHARYDVKDSFKFALLVTSPPAARVFPRTRDLLLKRFVLREPQKLL